MIEEDGSNVPEESEIEDMIDRQFIKKAKEMGWQKCGLCDYYGTNEQIEFHMLGQHRNPN